MSEFLDKLRSEAEAFAAPISAQAPGGADISYDTDFGVVREEIDKLINMSGDVPNWSQIISQGESLLKDRSKDMRLMVWTAAARMKRDGIEGFAHGLAVTHAACQAHWEVMFPPINRAKARGNLASWLGDLFLAQFEEYVPTAKDKEGFSAVETLFNDLDQVLSEKLGDKYQGMGPIRSLLRDKARMIPEPAAASPAAPSPAAASPAQSSSAAGTSPATAAAPAATAPLAVAPAAPAIPAVSGAGDVLPALRTMSKGIVDAARHVRTADPSSAWGYRLNRIGAWLAVKQPPPAEGGRTKIPPPQPADVNRLTGMLTGQQWPELVAQAEGMVGRFLFWLDLHRMVATGLERQGPMYQEAKKTVVSEVLSFVEAQPQVLQLSFADGTPFADEMTIAWIEEERAKLGGGGGSGGSSNARVDEEEAELKARFEEARGLVDEGKVGEGLGLAIQLSRRSSDQRTRFRARLEAAQMAIKASKPELARPILEGLVDEADEHQLEVWEPELCAQLYLFLLKSRTAKGASKSEHHLGNEIVFDRLCRLDPAAALKVGVP